MWPLINLAILTPLVLAAPSEKRAGPTVTLDHATVVGSSLGGIDSFKGIPYAQPPTGQLRLKPPQAIMKNLGTVFTTPVPRSCPQFFTQTNTSLLPENVLTELINTPLGQAITFAGEDCLTVNVQRPSSATSKSKLPVVFWIYGGGFEFGSTVIYDASELISTSVANGQDIMYVSVNYRLGGFGFLAGKEILKDGSSNLGLLDQRLALQWVADNIEAFGGDPSKVTIWGESAGSISVLDQMVLNNGDNTYKGKPLFRAGLMDSGSIVPADPVDGVKGQQVYDHVVDRAGCSGSADTLACLRSVSYEKFLDAAVSVPGIFSYNSVALSYLPRPDGVVLAKSPDILVQEGKMATVPFIVGDQEDEGTLFSLSTSNVTTTEDLVNYLKTIFFLDATTEQVETLVSLYPTDPSAGSPYNTGILNQLYPQYKRIASLLGDIVFILTRRVFLQITTNVYPSVPSWSYLASYGYGTPILGTFHASDILPTYGIVPSYPSTTIQQYYINYFNNADPNKGTRKGLIDWPQWNKGKQLLHFKALSNSLLKDDFRTPAYNYLAAAKNVFHI